MSDPDIDDMFEAIEGPVSKKRAERFYDRLRTRIAAYLEKKGRAGHAAEYLLFVPDVFILLLRLATDRRVEAKDKMLVGTAIAYYIFPLDIMPEAILGPLGFLDDLVLGVYVLNRILQNTDEELLRQHWSGDGDVLDMIRRVLRSADSLVASDFLKKIKKIVK